MKYFTTIFFLIFLNLLTVLTLLYFGDITRKIEMENKNTLAKIKNIKNQLKINEVEFNLYSNYFYLKDLEKIYSKKRLNRSSNKNQISLSDFKKQEINNILKVSTN